MRLYNRNYLLTAIALTLSSILCNNQQITFVESQASGSASLSGSLTAGGSISGSASGSIGGGSGGGSASGSAAASGSSQNGASASGSSSSPPGSGASASGSASLDLGAGSAGASAAVSANAGTTTPKPKGLLTKVKDILKEGKEILTGDQKLNIEASAGGSKDGSSGGAAAASLSIGTNGSSSGGGGSSGSAAAASASKDGSPASGAASASLSIGGSKSDNGKKEGIMDKVEKTVEKGTEIVKDTYHKMEDKAHDIGDKVTKVVDDNIVKPMQSVGGSGTPSPEGLATAHAQATLSLKGSDKEKYLNELKTKQENESISKPTKVKDIIQDAKRKGVIPQNEDRSALRGNHDDEKSVAVEVFDKAHELSKAPVERVLRPFDKMLGYEKDPLLRIYDNVHQVIRKPLGVFSKPVENVLQGAFKTTEETKKEQEKLLSTKSEQERREYRIKEEKARKEDRSVVGSIADKSVELATKPIEIVLRPIDHLLGYDKPGRKNPFLRLFDMVYSLSKKPVDAVAKPFERILKKMGEEDRMYQVSIRYQNEKDNADPKLVTRLADGALNIADRVLTKPLEIFMRPMDKALGYDDPGKKNPLIEAAHSLKNATKVGVELFTRPIDRILKEINDVGRAKTEAESKAYREHQKEIASRLVRVMDKTKNLAQLPFEIVLRPVGKIFGANKEGKKEPILRVWDYIHSIIRAPVQVISKPIEDALLGEQQGRKKQGSVKVEAKVGVSASTSASASASTSASESSSGGAQASSKAKASASADSKSNSEAKAKASAESKSNSDGSSSKAKASASVSMSASSKN